MNKYFKELEGKELVGVNGGGVPGMIVGCLIGSTIGLIGGPIVAIVYDDLDEGQEFFYGSFLAGGSLGFYFGP